MKKISKLIAVSSLVFSFTAIAKPVIELYKSPSCTCCTQWAEYMEGLGYKVNVAYEADRQSVKSHSGMPNQLASCHTAMIDGYVIEGHVPEADIARLLKERPDYISGIAAPGMPQHSPGMAAYGQSFEGFNVIAFNKQGNLGLYSKY